MTPYPPIPAPSTVMYRHIAGVALDRFLRAVEAGRLLGSRCPDCRRVYVPCRATCPTCGVRMAEDVEVSDHGVVTTYCIVNVPFAGQVLRPPYVCAHVLLDGADVAIFQLVGGCAPGAVTSGLRVRARWVDPAERTPGLESIRWFEPEEP